MPNTPVVDPWLEADNFGAPLVDFATRPEDMIDPDEPMHLDAHPSLNPEVVIAEGGVIRQPTEPIVELEPEGPEVIDIGDGATITLEKDKGWWKASLDPGNGANAEVFKGKNKNELMTNVLSAKLKATQKIRELNRQVKLGGVPKTAPAPAAAMPQVRNLTADEIFEIKAQLESDPGLAFDTLFQKQYGVSMATLVQLAQKGANADANLGTEAVAKEFLARNADTYYPVGKNETLLIQWLAKYKLGKPGADIGELYTGGVWTVENLEEAFQDLASDDLLAKAPKAPKPTPPVAVQPNEPAPAPRPDERIVRTETRPRAGLGIQRSDVSPVPPPEAPRPPSVEDLESLSDTEIANLLAGTRRIRALNRRSQ